MAGPRARKLGNLSQDAPLIAEYSAKSLGGADCSSELKKYWEVSAMCDR